MKIEFLTKGRKPKCQPNPLFPNGVDADLSNGAALTCTTEIPYPAPCCGLMVVECEKCGLRVAVTTAGRVDDPRSVKMACQLPLGATVN